MDGSHPDPPHWFNDAMYGLGWLLGCAALHVLPYQRRRCPHCRSKARVQQRRARLADSPDSGPRCAVPCDVRQVWQGPEDGRADVRVDVRAQREGEHYVVECTECGPLAVCTEAEAVGYIKAHLREEHGVTHIEGGPS